jgi:hypothetical protein
MCVKPPVDAETGEVLGVPQYQEFVIEGADFDHWRDQWWRRVEQYYMTC